MSLFYTVGLPRSGKTTYCQGWIRLRGERPRVMVSGDDFRTALHGKEYLPLAESFVFAAMDCAIRALLCTHDVIIDETSTSEQTILRWLRIDHLAQPIFMDVNEGECIRRARAGNQEYLVAPIKRMAVQMRLLKKDYEKIIQKLWKIVLKRQQQDVSI